MLTVKDLLNIEELKGITVIAGEQSIDNQILQVNIMENPDAFDWLTPGEMLLTTGYIFKEDDAIQKHVIRELAQMNCSALGFKLQRYFDKVPEAMIKLANKLNLPILSIPYDYNFTTIISVINQNQHFNYGAINSLEVATHNKMFRIIEAGNGSKHLLQEVAESIQNPVLLLDQHFVPIYYTELPNNPVPLEEFLTSEANNRYIQKFLKERINSSIRFYEDPISLTLNINHHLIPLRIFPIQKNNIIISYLMIWNTVHELIPQNIIQLKISAQYLLMQLQLEESLKIEDFQKRNELFFEVIRNKYQNEEDLNQFIQYYQLKTDSVYSIAILSIANQISPTHQQMLNLSAHINQMLKGYRQKIICIEHNHSFILLFQNPPRDEKEYLNSMNNLGNTLLNQLAKGSHLPAMTLIIGPNVANLKQVYLSYQKALQTLDIYNRTVTLSEPSRIISYDDIFLKLIARDYLSVEGLNKIKKRFVEPLQANENTNATDYITTLQAYFEANRSVTKASDLLFIHRNTLLHRLSKIEDILNIRFDVPGDSLQLEFVLYILPFL